MTEQLNAVLSGLPKTLELTIVSFLVGGVLAVPLVALRVSPSTLARTVARALIDLIRAIPPITWLFLIYFGLPGIGLTLDAMPAALAGLSIISAAYLAECYRSGLMAVRDGQREAAQALGLGWFDVGLRIVVPQAVRTVIPLAATYAIGLLKDTAVASTLGVAEITFNTTNYAQQHGHFLEAFAAAGVVYLLLSVPFALVTRGVNRRLQLRYAVV